jgi:hypothetical protein
MSYHVFAKTEQKNSEDDKSSDESSDDSGYEYPQSDDDDDDDDDGDDEKSEELTEKQYLQSVTRSKRNRKTSFTISIKCFTTRKNKKQTNRTKSNTYQKS